MKPKEKAEELVEKFYSRATSYSLDRKNQNENAKQCAVIAVDEIMNQCFDYRDIDLQASYDYWQEVKDELKDL
jgi:hypothetical protein